MVTPDPSLLQGRPEVASALAGVRTAEHGASRSDPGSPTVLVACLAGRLGPLGAALSIADDANQVTR